MAQVEESAGATVSFLIDFVVIDIKLPKDSTPDPKRFNVSFKLNKIPLRITGSRINVNEFKPGRRSELTTDLQAFRQSLEEEGLTGVVKYGGANMGAVKVILPQTVLDRISPTMNDELFTATGNITRREAKVGSIEIMGFLTIKCDEPVGDIDGDKTRCVNIGKAMNLADIMFLMGPPEPCRKVDRPCEDHPEQQEGDERLKLDLARYMSDNRRQGGSIEDAPDTEICCQLQTMKMQYSEVIKAVVEKVAQMPSPMPDEDIHFTDWSGKPPPFRPTHKERTIPIPSDDIEAMGTKPIRFCPVCLTAMSWLPKYAACPVCNTKAMPKMYEDGDREQFTAEQIMQECLRERPASSNDDYCIDPCKEAANGGAGKRRCTCKNMNFCTHCRVSKLCGNIFKNFEDYGYCPEVKPGINEDFRIIVDPVDKCRPYLERVFTELQDVYEKRDAQKLEELNKRSTESLMRFGSIYDENGTDLANRSSTGTMLKRSGSPTFLHRSTAPKIGHKTCVEKNLIVSRRHGWAWPLSRAARKHGWRPGAICRYTGAIMKFFFQHFPEYNALNTCRQNEEDRERRRPILNICKRNGDIYITLRAINNPRAVAMKPIVFKLVKSDVAAAMRDIKHNLKEVGFRKCTCHQPVMMCVCRNNLEKRRLETAIKKQSKMRGIESCVDKLVLTDTSDTDLEYNIDITPPAGVAKPILAIKPRTINITTQTETEELQVAPKYPTQLDPYWRSYDCAAGDRYTGTAFGSPGEPVFEDGIFGHGGGGPHGESTAPGGKAKPKGVWGAGAGGPMGGGGRGGGQGGIGGGRGGSGGGGGGGFGGAGGKSFPGAKKVPGAKSEPIPVRMPKRHYEAIKHAGKAEKEAIQKKIEQKKRGPDMMKYLVKQGAVTAPWNPNEPKPEVKTKSGPVLGTDGLTDAQRKRRSLVGRPVPPFEALPKRCMGYDPCMRPCYAPCNPQCCYPNVFYC